VRAEESAPTDAQLLRHRRHAWRRASTCRVATSAWAPRSSRGESSGLGVSWLDPQIRLVRISSCVVCLASAQQVRRRVPREVIHISGGASATHRARVRAVIKIHGSGVFAPGGWTHFQSFSKRRAISRPKESRSRGLVRGARACARRFAYGVRKGSHRGACACRAGSLHDALRRFSRPRSLRMFTLPRFRRGVRSLPSPRPSPEGRGR
jgi:hypothetical protein